MGLLEGPVPPLALGVPPLLLNQDHSPSSLESVDDDATIVTLAKTETSGEISDPVAALESRVKILEEKCNRLEEEKRVRFFKRFL